MNEKEKRLCIFTLYAGRAIIKNSPSAYFFVTEDNMSFAIFGSRDKNKKAPAWIAKIEDTWRENNEKESDWIVKDMNVPGIWFFKKYLADNVVDLRLFDEDDEEINVKEEFADDNIY